MLIAEAVEIFDPERRQADGRAVGAAAARLPRRVGLLEL